MKDALGLFMMIKRSLFLDLSPKDGSVSIRTQNLQVLATEIFKVYENMLPELMQELFSVRQTHYNLRNLHHFPIPSINSVYHVFASISNLVPRIWLLVTDTKRT